MRSLPAAMTAELAKEIVYVRHLYKLTAAATYRWTDSKDPLWFDSLWWVPKPIKFDVAQYSLNPQVDSITIEIENIDKEFSTIALAEDLRGKEVVIYRICLDANLDVIGAVSEATASCLFLGYVDQIRIDRRTAKIQVYNHLIKWRTATPRRLHSPTCQWVFKSTDNCTYAGASTWCNHSWERCVALSNSTAFGGFRWLPELAQTELYWGGKPRQWQKK